MRISACCSSGQLVRVGAEVVEQPVHQTPASTSPPHTRAGPAIAGAHCSRVSRGVRYWPSLIASGSSGEHRAVAEVVRAHRDDDVDRAARAARRPRSSSCTKASASSGSMPARGSGRSPRTGRRAGTARRRARAATRGRPASSQAARGATRPRRNGPGCIRGGRADDRRARPAHAPARASGCRPGRISPLASGAGLRHEAGEQRRDRPRLDQRGLAAARGPGDRDETVRLQPREQLVDLSSRPKKMSDSSARNGRSPG